MNSDGISVLDLRTGNGPTLEIGQTGSVRAVGVVWPGMGARDRSVHLLTIESGGETRLLRHPAEAAYYVIAGRGLVRDGSGLDQVLVPGAFAHISADTPYAFVAASGGAIEIVGGPCPPDPALYPAFDWDSGNQRQPRRSGLKRVRVLHRDQPDRMLPMIAADARLVVWPGTDAQTATFNYVDMQPGEANVPHEHEYSEDTLVVLDGEGSVDDLTHGVTHALRGGQVVHIPRGLRHCVKADRGSRIESVGGPAPADMAFLEKATASQTSAG